MLKVSCIHFNHDATSASGDALNIRLNHRPGTALTGPEWRNGHPSLPVAYARDEITRSLTIQAKFSGGPSGVALDIRAVDANQRNLGTKAGCLARLLPFVRSTAGFMGNVKERRILFDEQQNSSLETFEIVDHQLIDSTVGIYNFSWRWQYRTENHWEDFDITDHKVYLILTLPNGPWVQDTQGDSDEVHQPWVSALDVACTWAMGAEDKDQAVALITKRLNTDWRFSYDFSSLYGFCYFKLSSFLADLDDPDAGRASIKVNCTDCATIVTTLANLLGCDIFEGVICVSSTKKVLRIGDDASVDENWQENPFCYHEVAWLREVSDDSFVYDACLEFDGRSAESERHLPILPVKMLFGRSSANVPTYKETVFFPGTSLERVPRRRMLTPSVCDTTRICTLCPVREYYEYSSWRTASDDILSVWLKNFVPWKQDCLDWEMSRLEEFDEAVHRHLKRILWKNPQSRNQRLLTDVYENHSLDQAYENLISLLGTSEALIFKRGPDALGNISFVSETRSERAVLWVRGNLCFSIRSLGGANVDLVRIAFSIDSRLTPDLLAPDVFVFPAEVEIGSVHLISVQDFDLNKFRTCKFSAYGGELFFEDLSLCLRINGQSAKVAAEAFAYEHQSSSIPLRVE